MGVRKIPSGIFNNDPKGITVPNWGIYSAEQGECPKFNLVLSCGLTGHFFYKKWGSSQKNLTHH
jgi:hypothetical protein